MDVQEKIKAAKPKIGRQRLPKFDLAIIDADSLIYQVAWTRPTLAECKKLFSQMIVDVMDRTETTEAIIYVKGTEGNFRYFIDPYYKVKRRDRDYTTPEVAERIAGLLKYVQDLYGGVPSGEADDWCRITAQKAILEGKRPVVCHIDKDLNMIPGWHYHMKVKEFYHMSVAQAYYFAMKQFIIGDMASDSIPGLMKIGEVKAAEKFRACRLSELRDKVKHLWITNSHGIQQNNPEVAYKTKRQRLERMLQSINLLYLRETEEAMRELTPNEIWEMMKWDPEEMGEDPLIDADFEMIRMGVYSLSPATYTSGEIPKGTFKNVPREKQVDIRKQVEAGERKRYEPPEAKAKVRYKTSTPDSRVKRAAKRYDNGKDKTLLKRKASPRKAK
jgi:hypothetical protein